MAKKQRRRVRDTWKEKSWYTIKTPVAFGDKEIGTTPARDPELVYGRTVEVTMRELTGDFSKQYIKVRSMIRRGTSRIDAPVIVTTQDERKLKLHVLAVTTRRAKSSQQKYMRETINELVTKVASEKTFDELVENSVNGRLASEIYHKAKKIYPLKRVILFLILLISTLLLLTPYFYKINFFFVYN